MEDENFDKLSVEERCAHKSWKARISGYTSALQLFEDIAHGKSDEWNKYVPVIKSIFLETNDPALEKGLEVVLAFVLNASAAGKIVGHIAAGLVKKCVASSRARTRDLALQICLACVEIEKQKVVTEELLKGSESKNPKTSASCVHILTEIIAAFGALVLPVEGILLKLPVLLEDRDQSVRNEAKSLTVEMYQWLGEKLRGNLLKPEILKAQKLAEIVSEIANIKDRSSVPTRFLRSQNKIQCVDLPDEGDLGIESEVQIEEYPVAEAMDYLKPTEIISQIPESFYDQVKSPKWVERKEGLEALEKLLSSVEKIQKSDFNEIIDLLVNIISKDANVNVVCLAVKCVTYFAQKLHSDFGPYSTVVFRALLEKLKEKKPSVVQTLREAMDAVSKSSTFELFVDDLSESLKNKNPCVKSEGALFLSQHFSRLSQTSLSKKSLKPLFSALVGCLSDQDPNVRDRSAKALGAAMGMLGEKGLSPLLKDLEKTKLSKIKEYAALFLEESKNAKTHSLPKQKECAGSNSESITSSKKPIEQLRDKNLVAPQNIKKMESTSLKSAQKPKESIAGLISDDILKALSDKDWSVRMQAILDIQIVVTAVPEISDDLGDLGPLLSLRMLECNPKISTASINLVTSLARKIGPPFREQLKILLPALLKAAGDVKRPVRDAAVSGLTIICENCGYSEIFKSESLPESLKSGSNIAKAKLWRWVAEKLPKIPPSSVPKTDMENILPMLFAGLEDKNADVRAEATNAADSILKVLSLGTVVNFCDKFYGNSNNSVVKIILDKHKFGAFTEAPETPSKSNHAKSKSIRDPSPVISRKKVTFMDDANKPLLDVNNLKNQRVIDEHKHKTAKWDFVTPRAEFVELLKGLMSAANFSQDLTELMFHGDFRCHIKAMDLLTEEIAQNSVGIVCNLDLILRWLTLRFFDGNPIVLSKSLDFVIAALANLKEIDYSLLDSEAFAFVPYLVMKLGDSKENIQNKVKEILVNLTSVYPVSKLKRFVMDGARSNITRQRANCLDVIVSYINIYGDSVYLREIDSVYEGVGKLLKDRDPGVKKKAFLAAGMLYDREGEKILKFIEKNAGEDFRVIEDKIRKYAMSKPDCNQSQPKPSPSFHSMVPSSECEIVPPHMLEPVAKPEPEPETESTGDLRQKLGRFHWNPDLVQEIDNLASLTVQPPDIVDMDLEFMQGDIQPISKGFQLPDTTKLLYSANNPPILSYIESIGDSDMVLSKNGVKYIDMILNSGRREELERFSNDLIHKLAQNLENLGSKHYNEALENYGATFTLLLTVCTEKTLIQQFSEERLHAILRQLLSVISSHKFEGKENEIYRKTVNTIILKILENSQKTPLVCALLRLLGDTRETGGTVVSGKLNELCMKCLWKLNRAQAIWDGELDYVVIFSVIRVFLKGFPIPWYKSRPGDMSLRTVKTFLKTMVKLRGKRVLDDAGVDDECHLRRYLSKLVKHVMHESLIKPNQMITTAQNLAPCQAKDLSDIFSDIALNTPGAIQKLNDFKRRNPFVDLHRILATLSPAFFKYFLAVTGETEETIGSGTADADPTDEGNFSKEVGRMWDKLKLLQERIDNV